MYCKFFCQKESLLTYYFLKKYFVSCGGGVIDSDFWGIYIYFCFDFDDKQQHEAIIVIKAGQRIAQIVFHKKGEVVLKKVDCLNPAERGTGGFGSTGL